MSDLIMRAEQGLLAAMLTDTHTDFITTNVDPDDFAHPTHQAVYRALRDVEMLDHSTLDHGTLERRSAAVAGIVDTAGVDAAWLRALADQNPGADLVPQYAQIVVQAAFDRETAEFAQFYRDTADTVDESGRDGLLRVAAALDAQAVVFTPASTIDPDRGIQLELDLAIPLEQDVHLELDPEDQIIADIVQHPEQATAVAHWLDSAVFSTAQRRLTFELAVSLAYDHDQFDTVTLAWQIERAREVIRYDNPDDHTPDPGPEDDYTYLNRLRTMPVAAGTAVIIGRELITEHVHTAISASAAAAADRDTRITREPAPRQALPEPPLVHDQSADIRPIEL
jgi:DnaB helicase-like protein